MRPSPQLAIFLSKPFDENKAADFSPRAITSSVNHIRSSSLVLAPPDRNAMIQPDDHQGGNDEMKASLDRIDSSGHYEQGNLQLVCKFINRWKGAAPNAQFLSLLNELRRHWQVHGC